MTAIAGAPDLALPVHRKPSPLTPLHSPSLSQFRPWLPALLALWPLVLWLRVAAVHVPWPYELEWLEGEAAVAALRWKESGFDPAAAYPRYGMESGYTAHLYPPVYQITVALVWAVTGTESLAAGRALSVLGAVGIGVLIAVAVGGLNHGRDARATLNASATFAGLAWLALYGVTGFWTTLMRVDTWAWFLATASAVLLLWRKPCASVIAAGCVLGALAVFTKQTTFLFPLVAGLAALARSPRRTLAGAAMALPWVVAFVAWLHFGTDGAVWFYLLELPRRHVVVFDTVRALVQRELWGYLVLPGLVLLGVLVSRRNHGRDARGTKFLAIAVFLAWLGLGFLPLPQEGAVGDRSPFRPMAVAFLLGTMPWTLKGIGALLLTRGAVVLWRSPRRWRVLARRGAWWVLLLGSCLVGVVGWVKVGGFVNSFYPIAISVCVCAGLSLAALERRLAAAGPLWQWSATAAILAALLASWFAPLPKEGELDPPLRGLRWSTAFLNPQGREYGDHFVDSLRLLHELGPVYVPHQNWLAHRAGIPVFHSVDAVLDVSYLGEDLPQDLEAGLRDRRWLTIVTMFPVEHEWAPARFKELLAEHYEPIGWMRGPGEGDRDFLPVTGALVKPGYLWVRKGIPAERREAVQRFYSDRASPTT